ncbi:NAD(P)/FAD-dependent oxidoreductase [Asticcacaulis tiandongensis]|uniref:NAD(P)/FAD-dependent oxidoreductase n=1 Tax=Asticcacaulis tiandongensis TaxID=2565365 RepID=UPI00112CB812|nr:NAD(P)/FAD-dependent oxidoreductase [Asticcacaulis tiandongensis]
MYQVDTVIIGAGVVGLATGRELALSGREVLVLEAEKTFGTQTSSRNSGVIHAGLYYPPGSLKARLCHEGRDRLYDYVSSRGIAHQKCGKLLVACAAPELTKLDALMANAAQNGVTDLIRLSADEARALEPEVHCLAACLSPSTGIIDVHELMLALAGDIENAGGLIVCQSPVTGWQHDGDSFLIDTGDTPIKARNVINSAGHKALPLLQALTAYPSAHLRQGYFAKGNYFSLQGRTPFTHLVYPMPGTGSLGVHATLDLAGRVRFGPDIEWIDNPDDLYVDPARADAFAQAIRTYWPALPEDALIPDYAGIRPKLHSASEPMPDFAIEGPETHDIQGLINLLGIESPGLTSALAIAALIRNRLDQASNPGAARNLHNRVNVSLF